jgi:hypothetical protein
MIMDLSLMTLVLNGIVMGLVGTLAMDLWTSLLHLFFHQPKPNWSLVGRWVGHLPRAFHNDIAQAKPVPLEAYIGLGFHYAIGVAYGVIFAIYAGVHWFAVPTFLPLWLFALLAISGGWFLLFPGMGLGWALAKVENPFRARVMGLVDHTMFAAGMWIATFLIV